MLEIVFLLNECTDPFSYESVRASMGAIFNVNMITSTTKNLIKWKLNNKINLIGTSLKILLITPLQIGNDLLFLLWVMSSKA